MVNVLFILADALRADRLHCCGNPQPTSPRSTAGNEGVLFRNVVANSNHTVPGLVSLFTGCTWFRTASATRRRSASGGSAGGAGVRRFACWARPDTRWPATIRSFTARWATTRAGATFMRPRRLGAGPFFLWHAPRRRTCPTIRRRRGTRLSSAGWAISPSLDERLKVVRRSLIVHRRASSAARKPVRPTPSSATATNGPWRGGLRPGRAPALLALYDGCVRMLDTEIAGYVDHLARSASWTGRSW